jgi:hypothetical protein
LFGASQKACYPWNVVGGPYGRFSKWWTALTREYRVGRPGEGTRDLTWELPHISTTTDASDTRPPPLKRQKPWESNAADWDAVRVV